MAEEAVIAIASYLTEGELVLTAVEAAYIVAAIEIVAAAVVLASQQKRAAQAQRDSYNESLRDRYVMVRGATEPRTLVLGRQRVSGPLAFISSYGTSRSHLSFCLPIAAHEIDAIEAIYFDNEQLVLDAPISTTNANVISINKREQFSISTSGGVFVIQSNPKAGSVTAYVDYGTTRVVLPAPSVAGTSITVTGATAGQIGTLTISYRPDPSLYAPNPTISADEHLTLDGSGNGFITLAHTPVSGAVFVYADDIGDGIPGPLAPWVSVVGSNVTITGAPYPGFAVTVSYQWIDISSRARVRGYLGAPGQTADAGLIAALPGLWTSAHVGAGLAYLVLEFDFTLEAFPGGLPNVSALIRAAKVYDPRTGLTAWSENPALLARHAATHVLCGNQPASAVNDAAVIAAANVCDTTAAYVVNGQTYTRAMYTAGLVHKSGTRPLDTLNDLTQAMAGKHVHVDGQLRVKAGSYTTPLQTLDETWLAGASPGPTQSVKIQPRPNRADVFNVATGKFCDEQTDYQVLDYPRVSAAPYVAEDGREMPLEVQFNGVTFSGQAQQVVASMMRDARQGLRLVVLCNMRAYAVEVFDNIYVTLARYGWVLKPFEVVDVTWTLEGGIQLTLKETSSTTWALGTIFSAVDPAPNTLLPAPYTVADIAGLSVTSGATAMKVNSDGTVQQRMLVQWTAITDPGVLTTGGGVEIRWGLVTESEAQWQRMEVSGDQTRAYLPDVRFGASYKVTVRGFNTLVRGRWAGLVFHTVTGVSIEIDTAQLAPSAATEIYVNTPGSAVTVTALDHIPDGFGFNTQVMFITFTPSGNGIATVHVNARGNYTAVTTAGIGAWSIQNAGGTYDGWKRNEMPNLVAAGTTTTVAVSATRAFNVTSGVAYTLGFYANKFKTADTFTFDNMEMRVEVLKR